MATELIELDYFDNKQFELPVDLTENVYNPNNDEFKRTLLNVKAHLRTLTLSMPPRMAQAVKAYHSLQNYSKVARKYRIGSQTVAKHVKSPKGQKLLSLLTLFHQLIDGPTAIERQQLLWRIALNNEILDPRISIAAVGEINRMQTDTPAAQAKLKQNTDLGSQGNVIIQIQDSRLTASKLDDLPNHMRDEKSVN
jgi:hypothetical protein